MPHDNKNSFVLFKNDRKTKDTHPDYTGSFTDEHGREFFADAWIKDGQKGKFMSGRVKLKEKQPATAQQPPTPPSAGHGKDLADEQIPF